MWIGKKSEMPITAQSAEETARQFVISHQLAAKDSLKVLGSAAASSDTIAVVIQHKEATRPLDWSGFIGWEK